MVKGDPRTTAVQEARRSTSPDGNRGGMASGEQDKDKMKLMTTWGVCIERKEIYSSGTEWRDELVVDYGN